MKKHPIQPFFSIPAGVRGRRKGVVFDSSNTEFVRILMRKFFYYMVEIRILEKFCWSSGASFDFPIIFRYLADFHTFDNCVTEFSSAVANLNLFTSIVLQIL